MTILLLIRHGENDFVGKRLAGRLAGVNLNSAGQLQARQIADALAGAPIRAIYSSPLERAVQTAEPLAARLGLEIQIHPGLIEMDIGRWQGRRLKELSKQKAWKTVQEQPSAFRFPGGESFAEAQVRIGAALEEIAAWHEEHELAACFSHSDPIALAVAYALGLPLDRFQRIAVGTGSITALMRAQDSWRLLRSNWSSDFRWPRPPGEKQKPG